MPLVSRSLLYIFTFIGCPDMHWPDGYLRMSMRGCRIHKEDRSHACHEIFRRMDPTPLHGASRKRRSAAGVIAPLWELIGRNGSLEAAYPPELLSIEAYTKGKLKPGTC